MATYKKDVEIPRLYDEISLGKIQIVLAQENLARLERELATLRGSGVAALKEEEPACLNEFVCFKEQGCCLPASKRAWINECVRACLVGCVRAWLRACVRACVRTSNATQLF